MKPKILIAVLVLAGILILSRAFIFVKNKIVERRSQQAAFEPGGGGSGAPLMFGFVHGLSNISDKKETARLISNIHPTAWRVSNLYPTVYDFLDKNGIIIANDTKIIFNLNDAFVSRHGYGGKNNEYYVDVSAPCNKSRYPNCVSTYQELETAWTKFMRDFMETATRNNVQVDYYDVFSEPDVFWNGLSRNQFFQIFKISHDIIRQYKPDAKISAPSISEYNKGVIKDFMKFAADNDLRLDAVAWHEFGKPEAVVGHVSEIKSYLNHLYENKPQIKDKEIHINEFQGPEGHTVPGDAVAWLYYLEKAGVDEASKACWDNEQNRKSWSDCENGLNGLLLEDNKTPQPLYWVYEAYGNLGPQRINSETSHPNLVSIASKNDSQKEVRVLVGNYGKNQINSEIKIPNYPYKAAALRIIIKRIPNNPLTALENLEVVLDGTQPGTGNDLIISLRVFPGEAYTMTII
ncbi:hypothetical protein HY406_01765 [Candidatus Giovannonibacteria bacterium]|nr:hypothetical protein [Candidatus Giovannonibacteria bacterium]